jgi:peptide deformylase
VYPPAKAELAKHDISCKGKRAVQLKKSYKEIVSKSSQIYETEESCLSLSGQRKVKRYKSVVVEFLDRNFKKKKQTFKDFEAQIIQHEIDHFSGIII